MIPLCMQRDSSGCAECNAQPPPYGQSADHLAAACVNDLRIVSSHIEHKAVAIACPQCPMIHLEAPRSSTMRYNDVRITCKSPDFGYEIQAPQE
jgi:hypothetical protein